MFTCDDLTVGMLHFQEQQFTILSSAKYTNYLLSVSDRPGGIVQMEARVLLNRESGKQETWTLNLRNTEEQLVPPVVEIVLLPWLHQKM